MLSTASSRPTSLTITIVLAILAAIMLPLSPAGADSFPDTSVVRRADGGTLSYCNRSSFTQTGASWYALDRIDQTTDITDQFHSSCRRYTDIEFRGGNLGGLAGLQFCASVTSATVCGRSIVIQDTNAIIASHTHDWYVLRSNLIHEAGHAIGLGHYPYGTQTMRPSLIDSQAIGYRNFEAHDKWHINQTW